MYSTTQVVRGAWSWSWSAASKYFSCPTKLQCFCCQLPLGCFHSPPLKLLLFLLSDSRSLHPCIKTSFPHSPVPQCQGHLQASYDLRCVLQSGQCCRWPTSPKTSLPKIAKPRLRGQQQQQNWNVERYWRDGVVCQPYPWEPWERGAPARTAPRQASPRSSHPSFKTQGPTPQTAQSQPQELFWNQKSANSSVWVVSRTKT